MPLVWKNVVSSMGKEIKGDSDDSDKSDETQVMEDEDNNLNNSSDRQRIKNGIRKVR